MIELTNIKKAFVVGEHIQPVLKGVFFTANDGDMISIQGRSGAGKSTLLHIIACLDNYDEGEYVFDGVDVGSLNNEKMAAMRNKNIGIILQDYALLNHRSVLFNVMLPMYFDKTPYKQMKMLALQALDVVGLKDMCRKKANKLSGGERQRVAIARAIVKNPRLILADEPTGALDYATGQEIIRLLKKINQNGATVIIITHDDNVASACQRRVYMDDGLLIERTSS